MKIGFNGSVMNAEEAVISIYDHGFLYGMGLFETFRTYEGRPYLLERHLDRLEKGCEQLGIRYKPDQTALRVLIAQLLDHNDLKDGYIRLTLSAGDGELGLPSGDYEQPNELLMVKSLPPYNEQLYRSGKELRLLHTVRNTPEGSVRFKSLHYMNNVIAKRELLKSGASAGAEGLMLNQDGLLAEGIVSNLFFVTAGVIRTPSTDIGILPGITRQRIIELAQEAGYRTEEGHYRWTDLQEAEEIWVTNSVQELVPITRLVNEAGNGSAVGTGEAGAVLQKLLPIYRRDTV
ncbi:MAG: aminodeoxychorismate lyase [Candidatus Pristimantibacillus sp.]